MSESTTGDVNRKRVKDILRLGEDMADILRVPSYCIRRILIRLESPIPFRNTMLLSKRYGESANKGVFLFLELCHRHVLLDILHASGDVSYTGRLYLYIRVY